MSPRTVEHWYGVREGVVKIVYFSPLLERLHSLGFPRRYRGLTLGGTIHFASSQGRPVTAQLLKHELCHVRQFRRHGTIGFVVRWLWQCARYGYANAPLELAARDAEWGLMPELTPYIPEVYNA